MVAEIEADVGVRFRRATDAEIDDLERAFGGSLPPVWRSLVQRAADLDRAGMITSCGWGGQAMEGIGWLTKIQGRVATAAAASGEPYCTDGAVYLGEFDLLPVVAIGSTESSAVVHVSSWPMPNEPLGEPDLLALRLADWVHRLHVREPVRTLAKLLDREPVLSAGGNRLPFGDLVGPVVELLDALNTGVVGPVEVVENESGNLKTRCIERGWYRDLRVGVDDSDEVDARALAMSGRELPGVNAVLKHLMLVVGASAASNVDVDDVLGLLGRGANARLSADDAGAALRELLHMGDLDVVLNSLKSRIEVIAENAAADWRDA